ncbi:hypothetical protein C8R45DRAFT_1204867 [Mycena sanguinolenta]|nr:hypothetical protein C8R45DRAFT_1204867 [Mycena sanguinolenta]
MTTLNASLSEVMDAVLSDNTTAQLFVEGGKPIRLFVDPGSVLSRPKLIRTLKSQGASVESDPKGSDFILVQSDVPTGQHFIRDWGAEKPVLESTWVAKSISAGRLLKESDQWGGCLAIEDPSVAREDLEQNSLPTPRITPVEPVTNTQPSNAPFPPPNNFPPLHPSQQPFTMNEPPNIPPAPQQQQPGIPNEMPQYAAQPGQPYYPYAASQPQLQPVPTGIPLDHPVYMMLLDAVQRGLNGGWGAPPMGPPLQNGLPPPGILPQGVNPMMVPNSMQNRQFVPHRQPPGLLPPTHQYSASPPISAPQSPSISHRPSVDLKGKGRAATNDSRASSSKSNNIFISESGEPLTFYVAIDVKKRNDILLQIRRNGGQISTQTTANFAILSFRSKDFETLLEAVISANGTAVKPAFVTDSVERNTLLDSSPYEYELPEPKVQKPASTSAAKSQGANHRKAPRSKNVVVKEERKSPELSLPRSPSPSPPPAHTRVLMKNGLYRWTVDEEEYALMYCKRLFARDREMSLTALAAKLHAKMPHHPVKGWGHRISQKLRDDIEQIRKRADIAWRKEQHQRSQQSNVPPAKRRKLSGDAGPQQTAGAVDFEHDLSAVTHFFANRTETDGAVEDWQKLLTEKTPCKTEASWDDFYNRHYNKINELYEMLVLPQGSGSG